MRGPAEETPDPGTRSPDLAPPDLGIGLRTPTDAQREGARARRGASLRLVRSHRRRPKLRGGRARLWDGEQPAADGAQPPTPARIRGRDGRSDLRWLGSTVPAAQTRRERLRSRSRLLEREKEGEEQERGRGCEQRRGGGPPPPLPSGAAAAAGGGVGGGSFCGGAGRPRVASGGRRPRANGTLVSSNSLE